MANETTEIEYVRKDDTFKEWRERTNQIIRQQNNFVILQHYRALGLDDPWVITSLQMNYNEE